jgi:hypothetical protein
LSPLLLNNCSPNLILVFYYLQVGPFTFFRIAKRSRSKLQSKSSVQAYVAIPHWSNYHTCQPIKGLVITDPFRIGQLTQTHFSFSHSTKTDQKPKNEEHDEQLHHPKTLTEFPATQSITKLFKFIQFTQNSTSQNHHHIEIHLNFTKINKKQFEITKQKKKLSEIPRNRHHQASPFAIPVQDHHQTTTKLTRSRRKRGRGKELERYQIRTNSQRRSVRRRRGEGSSN